MCFLKRHNPADRSTMGTLGHVIKIQKSFRFLPCISYENTGPQNGPSFSQQTQNRIENQMLCFDGPSFSKQTQNKIENQMFWIDIQCHFYFMISYFTFILLYFIFIFDLFYFYFVLFFLYFYLILI